MYKINKVKDGDRYTFSVAITLSNKKQVTLTVLVVDKEYSSYYGKIVYRNDSSPHIYFTLAECKSDCCDIVGDIVKKYIDTVTPIHISSKITPEKITRAENRIRVLRRKVYDDMTENQETKLHQHISVLSQYIGFYR